MAQAMVSSELGPGSLLGGRYRLVRLLGRGGMGSVWEATQEDLRRKVAVKLLDPALAADPQQVERFRREALAAAALGHSNIIAVTDFQWSAGEPPFLVMELLAGESLGARIEREGPLPVPTVAFVAAQLLDALGAAHAAGIVHRDVKPDNVYLTSLSGVHDVVKVLDFGVAKLDGDAKLTQSGAMVGTPAYMSPEQTRGEAIDARADLYAVGAAMYRALTGRLPFEAPTMPAMFVAIATRPPPPVSAWRGDVPTGLVAVIDRAMTKDPAARYQTAAEMRAALAPWSSLGPSTPAPSPLAASGPVDAAAATIAGAPPPITPVHGAPNTPVVVVHTPPAPMSDPSVTNPRPAVTASPPVQPRGGFMSGCATIVVALVVGAVVVTALVAGAFVLVARSKAATDVAELLREQADKADGDVVVSTDGGISVTVVDRRHAQELAEAGAPLAPDAGPPQVHSAPPGTPHTGLAPTGSASPPSLAPTAAPTDPFMPPQPVAADPDEAPVATSGKLYSGLRVRVTLSDMSDCPSCDAGAIRSALGNAQASFDACARRYAHTPPEHQSQVLLAEIGADGRYANVGPAARASLPAFDRCVSDVVRGVPPSGARTGARGQAFKVTLFAECPTFNCR
jgi:serine/threonine-protein kinase